MADETVQNQPAETPTSSAPVAPENTGSTNSDTKQEVLGLIAQLEAFLDEYMVKKAPFQIPMGGKEFLAKVAPYLVIIGVVIAVPALLTAFGLSAMFAPMAMMGGYKLGMLAWVGIVFSIGAMLLEAFAIPGLFKRTHKAWRLVFYATLVSLVGSLISLNLVGGIIGAIIGWYILFQVKELYKN